VKVLLDKRGICDPRMCASLDALFELMLITVTRDGLMMCPVLLGTNNTGHFTQYLLGMCAKWF
jgi:hypothetical protein